MDNERTRVIALKRMMGMDASIKPYQSQSATPTEKRIYITQDRLRVSRVFQALSTCGMKEAVVNAPARKPMSVLGVSGPEKIIRLSHNLKGRCDLAGRACS